MTTYTVYKDLRLKVEVKAASAQEAFDKQLEMDDNTFDVIDCDYSVWVDETDVSERVRFG